MGGTGCLRCDEFFSLATELPLTFSFLLPSVSLGRQTACAWHWATTGSQDTLQRIQTVDFTVSGTFKIPTVPGACFSPNHWERKGLTIGTYCLEKVPVTSLKTLKSSLQIHYSQRAI